MSWTCSLQVSDNCRQDGLFDAPASTPGGSDCCLPCARDRDLVDDPAAPLVETADERWPTADVSAIGGPVEEDGS